MTMAARTESFSDWLEDVTCHFTSLSDDEKNSVLDKLISISGPRQKYMLSNRFSDLLHRDFVGNLPPEMSVQILQYLGGEQLLSCCLVSKSWYSRISNFGKLWSRIVDSLGVVVDRKTVKITSVESNREIAESVIDTESEFCLKKTNSECLNTKTCIRTEKEQILSAIEESEQNVDSKICPLAKVQSAASVGSCSSLEIDENLDKPDLNIEPFSLLYKQMFCHVRRVLKGFNSGATIDIDQNFIDKGVWRVTSVKYHDRQIVTGSDDHTVQIWSLPKGEMITTVATHSVCCFTITDTHLYTASFNANAECWDLSTGKHTRTLCGHTAAVLAIDITSDHHFLLTGSVDKTAKLWDLRRNGYEQLVKTFDGLHMDWVFQVKFLTVTGNELLFVTSDSNICCLWKTTESRDSGVSIVSSSYVTAKNSAKFTSFYHRPDNPDKLFACQWTESTKLSSFCQFRIFPQTSLIQEENIFRIDLNNIKAFLLGAGTRFAAFMCSISRKDFHILDIPKQTVIATIATPDFYVLTRNGSTVTLCDTSWLDGFEFSSMTKDKPVFAAGIALNKVMVGTWADWVSKLIV